MTTGLLYGHPAQALAEFAGEHEPDLIVMGAKGLRATLGILLGGVAQQMVEYSRWPVLVVRLPYQGLTGFCSSPMAHPAVNVRWITWVSSRSTNGAKWT